MYIFSDSLYTRLDGPNTLTCKYAATNNAPRYLILCPVICNLACTWYDSMIHLFLSYFHMFHFHNICRCRSCVTNLSREAPYIRCEGRRQHQHFCPTLISRFDSQFPIWIRFINSIRLPLKGGKLVQVTVWSHLRYFHIKHSVLQIIQQWNRGIFQNSEN